MADVPGQLAELQQQLAALQAAQQQQHRNSLLRMANSQAGGAGEISVLVISKEQAGGLQPLCSQLAPTRPLQRSFANFRITDWICWQRSTMSTSA